MNINTILSFKQDVTNYITIHNISDDDVHNVYQQINNISKLYPEINERDQKQIIREVINEKKNQIKTNQIKNTTEIAAVTQINENYKNAYETCNYLQKIFITRSAELATTPANKMLCKEVLDTYNISADTQLTPLERILLTLQYAIEQDLTKQIEKISTTPSEELKPINFKHYNDFIQLLKGDDKAPLAIIMQKKINNTQNNINQYQQFKDSINDATNNLLNTVQTLNKFNDMPQKFVKEINNEKQSELKNINTVNTQTSAQTINHS